MGGTIDWTQVPLPDLGQPELAPYWEGTREGELRIPSCVGCGRSSWPPRAACWHCGTLEKQWEVVPPHGTLFTWTVVGHSTVPGFQDAVPYGVGVVELDQLPGVRMTGRLLAPPESLSVGAHVCAVFERVNEELTLALWELESI